MLGFISNIINRSHEPVAVAMVIEGLVALCKAEVCIKSKLHTDTPTPTLPSPSGN